MALKRKRQTSQTTPKVAEKARPLPPVRRSDEPVAKKVRCRENTLNTTTHVVDLVAKQTTGTVHVRDGAAWASFRESEAVLLARYRTYLHRYSNPYNSL